ncbi:MAG TPA: hypothetical protein VI306_00970 [Pyrinomonadaceae bacterium]
MRRIALLCLTLLIAATAGTAAIIRLRNSASPKASHTPKSLTQTAQAQKETSTPFDGAERGEAGKALWLTLKPTGFEPTKVTLPASQYFLLVQNATGLDRFGLVIEKEDGERLQEVRLEPFIRKWKKAITFQPGRYILSEIDHPEWQCVITVTER